MLILVILIVVFQQLVQQQHVSCFHLKQGIGQEGKKICVLHELGNKTQLGGVSGHTVNPSVGSVREHGARHLKN